MIETLNRRQTPTKFIDFESWEMPERGQWAGRNTAAIQSSRIGVGFETLDRYMFDPEKVYPLLHQMGAKWVRVQTGWSRCETTKGVYDFKWLDAIIDQIMAAGADILFSLTFGNQLYMPDANHVSAVGHVPLYYGKETQQAWVNYVEALGKQFTGRVKHWEIWNEPNIPQFWHPRTPNGAEYAELIKITAPAIRKSVSNATIVGIATCGIAPAFLEASLKAGAGQYIDACAIHPYQANPEDNLQNIHDAIRYLLNKYAGDRNIEIWQGENGVPSKKESHEVFAIYNMDETIQAKWIARRILIDLKIGFARTFYFHAVDLMDVPYRLSDGKPGKPLMMGLIHGKTYQPKESFHVFRRLCSLFDDESERAELFACFYHPDSQQPQSSGLFATPIGVSFIRQGYPLFAYWLSEDPQQTISPRSIDLAFFPNDLPFEQPVLLDIMTGQYYSLEGHSHPFKGGHKFRLPLADYPLILTDARVLTP